MTFLKTKSTPAQGRDDPGVETHGIADVAAGRVVVDDVPRHVDVERRRVALVLVVVEAAAVRLLPADVRGVVAEMSRLASILRISFGRKLRT
jgi:hypothetical protein